MEEQAMETTRNDDLIARLDEAISEWDRRARRNRIYKAATQAFWGSVLLTAVFLVIGV